jgi:hypothetical protein
VYNAGQVVLTALALRRVTVPAKTKTAIRRQDQVVLAVPIGRRQGIGFFVM